MGKVLFTTTSHDDINFAMRVAASACTYQPVFHSGFSLIKGMVAVAIIITLLVTPFLIVYNYIASKPHEWLQMNIPTLVEFYSGKPNDHGVTLEEIWNWDDKQLEDEHYFIQWLFPIKTMGVNPTAPPTNDATIEAFKQDVVLRDKMRKSLDVMLAFYGFKRTADGKIEYAENFSQKKQNWLTPSNHNYRRISRILQSLRLHGLQQEAQCFFEVLQKVYRENKSQISPSVFKNWEDALK